MDDPIVILDLTQILKESLLIIINQTFSALKSLRKTTEFPIAYEDVENIFKDNKKLILKLKRKSNSIPLHSQNEITIIIYALYAVQGLIEQISPELHEDLLVIARGLISICEKKGIPLLLGKEKLKYFFTE